MKRRRDVPLLALLSCLAVTFFGFSASSSPARAGDCHIVQAEICPPPVTVEGGTFEYRYVDSDQTFFAIPVGGHILDGGAANSIPQAYYYQPNCSENHPPDSNGQDNDTALCVGAVSVCGDGTLQLQVWARDAGTTEQWRQIGLECIGGPPTITLPHLITDLFPHFQADINNTDVTQSIIDISPPTLALVNFPVIAATTLAPATLHITDPLEADVQITPVPTWDFGDHTPPVTGPVGAKYDGTSALDDPAHYPLTHTYRQPGTYTVTLTVTWTAVSVTTADHPAPIPLPDPHPTATTTTQVNVVAHEAHAVLVSGG